MSININLFAISSGCPLPFSSGTFPPYSRGNLQDLLYYSKPYKEWVASLKLITDWVADGQTKFQFNVF